MNRPDAARVSRRSLVAGGAALAGSLATPAIGQERREWRMVTSWPKNLPGPGVTAQRLCDRIGAASGGRLTVKLHAAGEVVPGLEVLDAVSRGVAEIGHTASFYWQGKHPATNFFTTVPFGLTPVEHMAWIDHGGGQALWDELYRPFGVKPFMAGNPGFNMGGWFKKKIASIDDIKGLKIRVAGLGGEVYRRLGATPVNTAAGEMVPALSSGVIEAAEFLGPQSDLALGFADAARFYHYPGFNKPNGTGEAVIALGAWEALPADLKAVVADSCAAENAFSLAEAELANARALKKLTSEKPVELVAFPEPMLAEARRHASAILDEIGARDAIGGRILQSYRAHRATVADWSRISGAAYLSARGTS